MIQHVTHVYTDLAALRAEISTGVVARAAASSRAMLVQIYSAEPNHIPAITALFASALPGAAVVGATTVGEIAHGRGTTRRWPIRSCFRVPSCLTKAR